MSGVGSHSGLAGQIDFSAMQHGESQRRGQHNGTGGDAAGAPQHDRPDEHARRHHEDGDGMEEP